MFNLIKLNWSIISPIITVIIGVITTFYFHNKNKKLADKQFFESTFYNMIGQLDKIIENITVDQVTGKDAFKHLFLKSKINISGSLYYKVIMDNIDQINKRDITSEEKEKMFQDLHPNIDSRAIERGKPISVIGLKTLIDNFGVQEFLNIKTEKFYYYLNYITSIISFVDKVNTSKKDKNKSKLKLQYINTLKSRLSQYEFVFLFYYGLTIDENFKKLAEKYSLFEQFPYDLLANSMRDENFHLYNDNHRSDAERFVNYEFEQKGKYTSSIFATTEMY